MVTVGDRSPISAVATEARADLEACGTCGKVHVTRHGSPACKAHKRGTDKTEPCSQPPRPGLEVCRFHGGAAPAVRKAAAKRVSLQAAMLEFDAERRRLGLAVDVEPADAMLAMVTEAAGNVVVLRSLVGRLDTDRVGGVPVGVDGDGDVSGGVRPALVGLAGNVNKPAEALPHIWLTLYNDERDRLVRWAKMCRDAGVDERRVQLAEEQGDQLGQVLEAAMAAAVALVARHAPQAADELQAGFPELVRAAIHQVIDTTGSEAAAGPGRG